MINKKNELGKNPDDIGAKDAIHVAIVAVRAGSLVRPGQRCGMNEFGEAIPHDKGVGVADPFLRSNLMTGQTFWLLLNQDAVPNVRHVWEHPQFVGCSVPTRDVQRNKYLAEYAEHLGVTYEQLMDACAYVMSHDESPAPYCGSMTAEAVEEAMETTVELGDLWMEWSAESGHEFVNNGSECCPEYEYPRVLFAIGGE